LASKHFDFLLESYTRCVLREGKRILRSSEVIKTVASAAAEDFLSFMELN